MKIKDFDRVAVLKQDLDRLKRYLSGDESGKTERINYVAYGPFKIEIAKAVRATITRIESDLEQLGVEV